MRQFRILGFSLFILLVATPSLALAQARHIATTTTLQQAVSQHVATEQADRAVIARVMHQPSAQTLAARMGLTPAQVDQAIATLDGNELASAAAPAREAAANLAGGDTTIVITTTTLLLLLILVVLIVR